MINIYATYSRIPVQNTKLISYFQNSLLPYFLSDHQNNSDEGTKRLSGILSNPKRKDKVMNIVGYEAKELGSQVYCQCELTYKNFEGRDYKKWLTILYANEHKKYGQAVTGAQGRIFVFFGVDIEVAVEEFRKLDSDKRRAMQGNSSFNINRAKISQLFVSGV